MNSAHLNLFWGGRFPSSSVKMTKTDQGVIYDAEAMISVAWAKQLRVKQNDVLMLEDVNSPIPNSVRLHLVGFFEPKSLSDPAWFGEKDAFTEPVSAVLEPLPPLPIWLDEPAFETLSAALVPIGSTTFTWSYYLDHTNITPILGSPVQHLMSVLAVDSAAFPRLAYWRSDFADQPLPDLMARLTQPVSQSETLPALVDDQVLSDLHLHIGNQVVVQLGPDIGANFLITGTFHYFPTLDTTYQYFPISLGNLCAVWRHIASIACSTV